jgi:hypothetical protein
LLIKLLNPDIFEYLYKSHYLIKNILVKYYKVRKKAIRKELANSILKIYISFNLWTSPSLSKLAIIKVVAHYLSNNYVAKSLLIGFKSLLDNHTDVNQAASVYSVLKNIGIALKAVLGYFISDNTSPNDTAIEELCRLLEIEN